MTVFKGVVEKLFAFVSLLVAVSEKMLKELVLYQRVESNWCTKAFKTDGYIRRNGRHQINNIKRPVLQVKRDYSSEAFYDADIATCKQAVKYIGPLRFDSYFTHFTHLSSGANALHQVKEFLHQQTANIQSANPRTMGFLSQLRRHFHHLQHNHLHDQQVVALAEAPPTITGTERKVSQRLSNDKSLDHSESQTIAISTHYTHSHHETSRFDAILANIDLKCVPQLASHLRQQDKKARRSPNLGSLLNLRYSCKVVKPALRGSFNILFPIRFRDKTEWLLKVPANGCDGWDDMSARALTSEVLTMKLIYNNSSIPVPRIYGYDSTPNNPIKCTYIMMERIRGTPLHHGWFQHEGLADSKDIFREQALEDFRERALKDLAVMMVQLNSFTFAKVGAVHYNASTKQMDVGPYKKVDYYAENKRPLSVDDDETTFIEQGPFLDPKQYFLASLDNENITELAHMVQGERKILRLFIDWFFQATSDYDSDFVLTHPDFNLQNVLVGGDGSLKGLVDWDGVAAVPRCIGPEAPPLWLTPDWDPHWYNYDTEAQRAIDEDDYPEMSPEELDIYREKYANHIEAALRKRELDQPSACSSKESDESPRLSRTRVAPLARSLYIAANEPISAARIVPMVLKKVMALTSEADYEDPASVDVESDLSDIEEGSEDGLTDITVPSEVSETVKGLKARNGEDLFVVALTVIRNDGLAGIANSISAGSIATDEDFVHMRSVVEKDSVTQDILLPWQRTTAPWLSYFSLYILFLPASLLLLADRIQSLNIFPTFILFASLLTTNIHFLSRLAVMILAAQLYTRILASTFWDERRKPYYACQREIRHPLSTSIQGTHSPTTEPGRLDHRENSTTTSLRSTSSFPPSPPDSTPTPPSTTQRQPPSSHPPTTSPPPSQPNNLSAIAQKWKEDPTHDFGTFTGRNIYNALYHGELDERRLHRLKIGFWRLLEQLDGRREWDGGVGGRDEGA
ncbi:MAG: hypothetical protein Q9204_005564 [Flavoplaca sp. TL-2023a]